MTQLTTNSLIHEDWTAPRMTVARVPAPVYVADAERPMIRLPALCHLLVWYDPTLQRGAAGVILASMLFGIEGGVGIYYDQPARPDALGSMMWIGDGYFAGDSFDASNETEALVRTDALWTEALSRFVATTEAL